MFCYNINNTTVTQIILGILFYDRRLKELLCGIRSFWIHLKRREFDLYSANFRYTAAGCYAPNKDEKNLVSASKWSTGNN